MERNIPRPSKSTRREENNGNLSDRGIVVSNLYVGIRVILYMSSANHEVHGMLELQEQLPTVRDAVSTEKREHRNLKKRDGIVTARTRGCTRSSDRS